MTEESRIPVTVLKVEMVTLTGAILEQVPIVRSLTRPEIWYDRGLRKTMVRLADGEMEAVGYVWQPDSVGHRACYWVLAKLLAGGLGRVHVHSHHSRPGDPPEELTHLSQIFVVGDNSAAV